MGVKGLGVEGLGAEGLGFRGYRLWECVVGNLAGWYTGL